jgi:ATP-dependent Clp protease adaptor protein ClpS
VRARARDSSLWTAGRRELHFFSAKQRFGAKKKMSGSGDWEKNDDGLIDFVVDKKPKTARAKRYCVVFYNDDYTTKWFVVHVLEQYFHMTETTATAFMMAVHEQGKGVAGVYTKDIAETKASAIMEYAREYEMPLKVTAEPDDEDDGN